MAPRALFDLRVLASSILLVPGTVAAKDLEGTWSGTWIKNGDSLPVVVRFTRADNLYSGTFDSDALQVSKIPFAEVSESGRQVHLVLKGDQSTIVFDGEESAGAIDGSLTENNSKGSFHLVRSEAATLQVQSRDVTFNNGDVKIAGSILIPEGNGRHAAILFLNGSGPEGRFANRWLAERFAQAGFLALIYDKRGVGRSSGDWKASGFDDLAGDAAAGIRFLRSLPEVDPAGVGIYGHSQGGTIAPLVAARSGNLAFIIASAPGGIDPAQVEEYSVGNSVGISSLPPNEASDAREFVHAIVDVAYRGQPRTELDAVSAKFRDRKWYFDPPPAGNFYWSFSRRIAGFQPARFWTQVQAPVLLLFAEKDERIPSDESARASLAALRSRNGADVMVKTFPGADHTFTLPVASGGWPKHVPDYANIMIRWATTATLRQHSKPQG